LTACALCSEKDRQRRWHEAFYRPGRGPLLRDDTLAEAGVLSRSGTHGIKSTGDQTNSLKIRLSPLESPSPSIIAPAS
jgi:hypothetical protein